MFPPCTPGASGYNNNLQQSFFSHDTKKCVAIIFHAMINVFPTTGKNILCHFSSKAILQEVNLLETCSNTTAVLVPV